MPIDNFLGPLTSFNFYITLFPSGAAGSDAAAIAMAAAGTVLGGFTECTGLDSEVAITDVTAGGINDRVFRFPGRASYSSITLKQGVAFSEDLYIWHESFVAGQGARRDGLIFLANETRLPIKIWRFERGIPKKWSGPSLDAGTSGIAMESLEIAHEKLTLVFSPGQAVAQQADKLGI